MVVFTCGHCGESLQKPKVEKHYLTKCRNKNPNLSCMDCFKDFFGNDYEGHTKCITEEQRYSAKGFVAKEKKGEQKQNVWVEMVQSVLDEKKDAPKNVLRILETVSKHNNTPRKKPKFYNFVKNVCGSKTGAKDIEAAWDLLAVKLTEMSNQKNQDQKENKPNEETNENGSNNKSSEIKNKSKDKINENGTDDREHEEKNKEVTNGDTEVADQKKTKKQLKEEKKRKKYEAELKSASEAPAEEDDLENDEALTKKDKKKKNRSKSVSEVENGAEEDDGNTKKRKRQITVSGSSETGDIKVDNEEVKPVTEKTKKKKPKVVEETDENLHDQNVAKGEEQCVTSGKFNWHAVIMSVLVKKGNEIPFKRLQKKVLGEYYEATGQDIDDRIADKFIKKLKSAPNVRVDKNRVLLVD